MTPFLIAILLASAPAPLVATTSGAAVAAPAGRSEAIDAVEALSLKGGPQALTGVADFLARWSGDVEMQGHGMSALKRLPISSADLLPVLSSDPDAGHRAWAAYLAGEQRMTGAEDALLAALKDADPTVRGRAVAALAMLGDARANDPLMKVVVHDPDPANRERATAALEELAKPRAERPSIDDPLAKLGSPDPFERLTATQALQKARDRRAVAPLLALLSREHDVSVRKGAISALADIKDEIAVPALVGIAKADPSGDVRAFAIAALAVIGDSRAVAPLMALASDPDPQVRGFSLRALGLLARPEAGPALLASLADPVPEVRVEAAKGIARLGDRAAADAIAERLGKEPDDELRRFLAATLGDLGTAGNAKHEGALIARLEDDDPGVQMAAIAALAKIGTSRAVKPLGKVAEKEKKKRADDRDPELIRLAQETADKLKAQP